MKILIVDDSNDKVEKILASLGDVEGVARDDFDVAFTTFDARRMLRDTVYDLMILDFLMPFRPGDRPQAESAVTLLTELRDREHLRKPRYIIGLTAFDEGIELLQPIFTQQTWTIARYSESQTDWAGQLRAGIRWILESSRQSDGRSYQTDVCLLTALQSPEHDAVLRNGWEWSAAEPLDDTTFVRRGIFQSGGKTYNAVAAHSPKMGMVPAALLAAKMIHREIPKLLIMGGICAGVKNRTNFGDPVIADPCWDWQSGKHVMKDGEQAFEIRPEQVPLPQQARARWELLRADREFWSKLRAEWPSPPDTELRVRMGPSVSGSSVLADASIVDQIKAQHGSLLALEMEAYGLLLAGLTAPSPRPLAFSCKSVCDLADERKDDRWQAYAAFTSARSIAEFCERYMADLDGAL